MSSQVSKTLLATAVLVSAAFAGPVLADVPSAGEHGHDGAFSFGKPATASEADRTIEVTMGDSFFEPERLNIAAGETVRFVIRNGGELLHEFNLGTAAMHAEHQQEMMTMMQKGLLTPTSVDRSGAEADHASDGGAHLHDDPNSLLLEPGATKELVWSFPEATSLEFACNVPGHYAAGMVGQIDVIN